jgi:predicted nucleotidyltransferase
VIADKQKSFYELTKHLAGSVEGPSELSYDKRHLHEHVQTKDDIRLVIQNNQSRIKALGVKKLGLFGSFVREEQHQDSDVDLLVEFEQGKKTFKNFMQLSFLLEDVLDRRVELVTFEALSPYIRPYIIQEVEYVSFTS